MKLLKWIKSLFEGCSYQDGIDAYITSKNPTTASEVDYWIREYDQHRKEWAL